MKKYNNEEIDMAQLQEQTKVLKAEVLKLLETKEQKQGEKAVYTEEELALLLKIEGKQRGLMAEAIDALEKEGRLLKNRRGFIKLPNPEDVAVGILQKTRGGFGFLLTDDEKPDIFLPKSETLGIMNGDRILVQIRPGRRRNNGKPEGTVLNILSRETTEVTGTLEKQRRHAFVIPDDRRISDIYIPMEALEGAEDGDKVRAIITKYEDETTGLRGKIAENYGKSGRPEAELRAVLHQYHIPESFPEEVLAEAQRVAECPMPEELKNDAGKKTHHFSVASLKKMFRKGRISPADAFSEEQQKLSARVDLRDKQLITIDGADAKDLDDAVQVERLENGNFLLGVHIADVSHYVRENSELDKEAFRRGCSVYLLDTVVPMLPRQLSNGICSLNEGEDRLTLSVQAEIDKKGNICSYKIFESIIRSCARMVYDDVSDILEHHDPELMEKYKELCPMLFDMEELAAILRKKRMKGGSLDFEIAETCIDLNEEGYPTDIHPAERRTANRLIEEFMLTANQIVAEHHFWMEIPFAYRVHEKPDTEKIERFRAFAGTLGYTLKGSSDNIHPSTLRDVLSAAQGTPEEGIISRLMLRSMQKADYQPICSGHFGLGFRYYCHFTSPIRRYPDLLVHRMAKAVLHGKFSGDSAKTELRLQRTARHIEEACRKSSAQERNAVEAERTIEKKKMVQYMAGFIGERFEGIISGVMNNGFFVELSNTAEGYVPLETLKDDYYVLDAEHYRLVGERTHRVLAMGGRVLIEVEKANLSSSEIDFRLIRNLTPMPEKEKRHRRKRREKKVETDAAQQPLEKNSVRNRKNRIRHSENKKSRRKSVRECKVDHTGRY